MNILNVKYPIRNKKSERFYLLFNILNTLLFVISYFLFSCFFKIINVHKDLPR
jgi:hypothetical protein